jgi:ATP-binding cassette, subfamily B, bacterial CvaB/MchF/RaxB
MRLIDRLQFSFKRTLPVYLQTQTTECGLICLAMVAAYFGEEPDLPSLRRRYRASMKGTNFEQLLGIAAGLEMTGRALRVDLEYLPQLKTPCILHWDMGHFVVLAGVKNGKATIHDPARGKVVMKLAQVSEHFTGAAMELMPSNEFGTGANSTPQHKKEPMDLWKLTGQVVGLKRSLLHIFLIGLAVEAITLVSPFFIQWVTDHAVVTGDKELLLALALGFGSLVLVRVVLEAVRTWAVMVMSTQFNMQWMANIFTHLLKLPILYYERRHLGDIQSRFGVIQGIQNTLTVTYVEAFVDGMMVIGTLVMMWIYSPQLAGVAVLAAVVYLVTRFSLYKHVREASNEKIVHDAKQQSIFMEAIRGIVSLRMANREEVRIASWLNHLVHMKNSSLRQQRYQLIFKTVNSLVFGLSRTAVVGLGALAVLDGRFSVGMLLAFMSYKDQFSSRASGLIDRLFELKLLELQGMRLADIVFMKPEQDAKTRGLPPASLKPTLALKQVRMRYGETEPMVLDGCQLSVAEGNIIAIAGHPGSGKTTLIKTMLGLFPNHGGEIHYGGVSIKKLGLHNYRDNVAGVLQDERPLAGTVAENLCFFAQEPDEDWLETCAQAVGLHDEINTLPMRYQTLIGDLGTALSASQRQKLLLARALYRKPQMLLIDEASSHLTLGAEQQFIAFCREQRISVVFACARGESFALADRVYVLQGGKLSEHPASAANNAPAAPTAVKNAVNQAQPVAQQQGTT